MDTKSVWVCFWIRPAGFSCLSHVVGEVHQKSLLLKIAIHLKHHHHHHPQDLSNKCLIPHVVSRKEVTVQDRLEQPDLQNARNPPKIDTTASAGKEEMSDAHSSSLRKDF